MQTRFNKKKFEKLLAELEACLTERESTVSHLTYARQLSSVKIYDEQKRIIIVCDNTTHFSKNVPCVVEQQVFLANDYQIDYQGIHDHSLQCAGLCLVLYDYFQNPDEINKFR